MHYSKNCKRLKNTGDAYSKGGSSVATLLGRGGGTPMARKIAADGMVMGDHFQQGTDCGVTVDTNSLHAT